jgi:phage gp36-like protein
MGTVTISQTEFDQLQAERRTARAEVERLRKALAECRDEIDGYIHAEYPGEHPVQVRRRDRDLASNPARAALRTEGYK